MTPLIFYFLSSLLLLGGIAVYLSIKEEQTRRQLLEREKLQKQKIYHIAILKEIQDRIGYSLDIEKIIDVITGSLRNLFSYSSASSLVVKEDALVFKTYLEETVNHAFLGEVEKSMLASLKALLGALPYKIDRRVSGVALDDGNPSSLSSFFHIPLVVNNKVVGLINVSSTKPNLYKEEEMTILYQITAQASNALSRLEEVLASEEQKREDLTNMMVHELRAPLTAIRDSSFVLASDVASLEKTDEKKLLDIIHEQSNLLLSQIGEILDAAKLEAGKLKVLKKPQENIATVIKKSLLAFTSQAAKKQITLALEGSYELPLLSLDPVRIGQTLNNLLSNSLKFTPMGGKVIVKTELIGNMQGRYIKISVTDTGVGIPLEKQKYLFAKYSQASELKGGTGLGLYVVKGIVEAHGGTVSLESKEGQGTTIYFTLPLDEQIQSKQETSTASPLPHQTIN